MILIYKLTNLLFRFFFKCISYINRGFRVLKSLQIGFFLGVFKKRHFKIIDKWYYNHESEYTNDSYNKTQPEWESLIIDKCFKDCKSIFVVAAGGGREVYNLSKRGFEVKGSEYNEKLCEYANSFLVREEIDAKIMLAERDTFPKLDKIYDGIIIGWGAYAQIKGSKQRIHFLKETSKFLNINGVILISFWPINFSSNNLDRIASFGNLIGNIFNNEKVEKGDTLEPEFIHCFSETEIENELQLAGFKMQYFSTNEYGHAVGVKI